MSLAAQFQLLGPLAARVEGRPLVLGGSRQRALLALLLIHPNESVGVERAVDELWEGHPPTSAIGMLRTAVSQLRATFRGAGCCEELLATTKTGYVLEVDPEQVDSRLFVERAKAAVRPDLDAATAVRSLDDALALWRGEALADFKGESFARAERGRLDAARLSALTARGDRLLDLGRHLEVVIEVGALVMQHPENEALRAQLVVAMYRSGRQAEALRILQDGRRYLARELGLEPGPLLRHLEEAILVHDPTLWRPVRERALVQPSGACTRVQSRFRPR